MDEQDHCKDGEKCLLGACICDCPGCEAASIKEFGI